MKFHHLGIIVNSIDFGLSKLDILFDFDKKSKIFYDYNIGVKVQFLYKKNLITLEIISPLKKRNPITNLLEQKKNILNHLAFKVRNLEKSIKKLELKGYRQLTKPQKALAFKKKKIVFLLSPLNIVIELISEK